jgi:hypothetical protein
VTLIISIFILKIITEHVLKIDLYNKITGLASSVGIVTCGGGVLVTKITGSKSDNRFISTSVTSSLNPTHL